MLAADQCFVGRAAELAIFESLLTEDSAPVLAFWGPPGVGKSTLLRHLSNSAHGWRSHVLDLEGIGLGSHNSAIAADSLLFGLARMLVLPESGTRTGRRRDVRDLHEFERRAGEAAREFLGGTAKIKIVQSASFGGDIQQSQVHVHSPQAITESRLAYRRSVVLALADLVRRRDMSRSLIFFDTAELLRLFDAPGSERAGVWPDTPLGLAQWFLRELIPELLDAGPGLRIVLAGREKFSINEPWIRQFEVAEWTDEETVHYLRGRGFGDQKFVETVHALCGGLPLWTAMLAEACSRQALPDLSVSSDWLRTTAHGRPTEQWLPEVFLSRLPAAERDVIVCAAVPKDLSLELIRRLLEVSGVDAPVGWWDSLCRYSFVRLARDREPGGHRYIHRMARAAILTHLDQQEPERLLALHREAAEYYERLSRFAEEAYHRFACGDYSLVGRWQETLANARRHHDIGFASRVLDAVIAPEQIIRITRDNQRLVVEAEYQQGQIEYTQDRFDAAIEWVTSALRGFQSLGDDQGESRSHCSLAVLRCYLGNYPTAIEAAKQALAAARLAGDAKLLLDAHSVAGMIYSEQGTWRNALSHYSAALRFARQVGDVAEESSVLREVSSALFTMDRRADAARYLELARQAAEGSPEDLALCHYQLGWNELDIGNPAQALDPLEQQLRILRTTGNRRDLGWGLRPVATALILLGSPDQARQCIAEALGIFDQLGDRTGQCLMHCLAALADLTVFQHQSALSETNAARMLSRRIPDPGIRGWIMLVLSAVGAAMSAEEWPADLQEALAQLEQRSHSLLTAYELTRIGDILILAEAHEAARWYLLYALKYARRSGSHDRQREICDRLASLRALLRASSGPKLANITGNLTTK
jgi:tetratricopeptide (TPR) repeat protein